MPRTVVVRRKYEALLRQAVTECEWEFLLGSTGRSRTRVNWITQRIELARGRLKFSPQRLRSTWLVDQITANTPVRAVLSAAGIKTIDGLRDAMAYVPPPGPHEAVKALREA
jgi:hypothetical protein